MSFVTDDTQPELKVMADMVRRGAWALPVVAATSTAIWGTDGLVGSVYGWALVAVNFFVAARLIAWAAPVSPALLLGAVMFGYLARLALLFVAVWPVRRAEWISVQSLCATMLITHLGLLVWEVRYVSISLAHPGLKPRQTTKS
ncbi:MAG: hypothetical protein RL383_898 [Actinomycetota bacterium]